MPTALISTEDLAGLLGSPSLRVVDASWHLDGRDAAADFEAARISGAVRFDLDAVSDHTSPLPHMAPTPEAFAAAVGALGIADNDCIVVYDTVGLSSAARIWWTFRLMGAADVRVLDGGLPRWRKEGRPLTSGPALPSKPAIFHPVFEPRLVASLDQVEAATKSATRQIVDARAAPRFAGQAAEPRPGLRSGHMPGALNLPFGQLIDPDGRLIGQEGLAAEFQAHGIDLDRPVITSCGSGVTAAILSLALYELGRPSAVYDGSWAEWGGRSDTAVETGDPALR